MALHEYDFDKEPTVSVVKRILTDAIKMKATDIHFDPKPNELLIRFRINGDLVEYTTAPENVKINILTRVKILAGMNITDSILPQTGAINFELDENNHNMRVSSLPMIDGEKIVVHISNYAKNLKSIIKIGLKDEDVAKVKDLIKEDQGIILVTGTTASGKTTTMYTLLKELNNQTKNIISIEDPVKMKIDGINQVQIAPEKGLNYRSVLRSVLLLDPNIIAINELIDDETTRCALRASVTGRLLLSSMHTKSAYQTIDTLLNMDVENYLLGANLLGIISQRLVKKLCPACKERKEASEYEKTIIKEITGEEIEELYYPKGCSECHKGYVDQIPVVEVVKIDEDLRNAISNNKNRDYIRGLVYKNNDTILKDGFKKVIKGETSFNEIIRITDVKIDFTKDEENIKEYILGNGEIEFIPKKETEIPLSDEELALKNNIELETVKEIKEEIEKVIEEKKEKVEEEPIPVVVEDENESTDNEDETTSANTEPSQAITDEVTSNANEVTEEKPIVENTSTDNEETTPEAGTTTNEDTTTTPEIKQEETSPAVVPTQEPQPVEVTATNAPATEAPTPTETTEQPIPVENVVEATPISEKAQTEQVTPNIEASTEQAQPINTEQVTNQPTQEPQPIEQATTTTTEPAQTTPVEASTPVVQVAQPVITIEDDDDDDDFNYGSSYVNKF